MENKKGINFFLAFITILLGGTLFKHFDFKTGTLADPYLDILYLIVVVVSIYLIVKDRKKGSEK